jgi:hypothetical protein
MDRIGTFVRGFGRFWYDFIVGDDPKIAVAVAAVLVLGGALVAGAGTTGPALVTGLAVLLLVTFTAAMAIDVNRSRRRRS